MSYEKQTWSTGETITANKLNHMEDGIADGGSGGGSLRINISMEVDGDTATYTMDKTWQQIHDAFANGSDCYGYMQVDATIVRYNIEVVSSEYFEVRTNGFDDTAFRASSADDYPSLTTGR